MSKSVVVPTGNAYDKYGTANPVERYLVANFLTRVGESLRSAAPSRILEVGIGEGSIATRVIELFPKASFVGVDLPDAELAESWSSLHLTVCCADIAALPFADLSFDLVLAIEVLEHVPHPEVALNELSRVAGGDVVISVPREPIWRAANLARGKYVRHLGNTPGHIQHWSRRDIVRLVQRHFDVRNVRTPFPWTLVTARTKPA